MLDIKKQTADLFCSIKNITADQINEMLEYPPDLKMGDVSLPCFKLSKILKKSPQAIASDLSKEINIDKTIFEKVETVGGYLNFFVDRDVFSNKLLNEILADANYGNSNEGCGKTILFDYSAPNIAKPFHIGHLPSTAIGNSLYRIYKYLGYNPIGINHLGDWGTQFGTMIVAYKNWGSKEKVEQGGVKELVRLYVKFHEEEEQNPELRDEARHWFSELEKGNQEAASLWKWFKDISLQEFNRVYDILGVKFDYYTGESFYNDKMQKVIDELKEKNLLVKSEGAGVVELSEYSMPPCIILKADGSTLYATRDLTAAFYRKNTFDFDKCVYITASAQNLHFRQWFKVVELMGYDWAKDLVHVPFGMISLANGESMSTRKGIAVWLDDVLSQATSKTLEIINEKNPGMENKEQIAQQMGVGAVIFSSLSTSRIKDVSFSWDDALNFDGETGPYVQYTHARACSILRKAGYSSKVVENVVVSTDAEYKLMRLLYDFPSKIKLSAETFEPSVLARYIIDVAQCFNRFYTECPIINAEENVKNTRLGITMVVKQVLSQGLWLIGLAAPERV